VGDNVGSDGIKNSVNEVGVPGVGVPEVRDVAGEMRELDRKFDVVVDIIPDITPRAGP
jgi:hypothetical protein